MHSFIFLSSYTTIQQQRTWEVSYWLLNIKNKAQCMGFAGHNFMPATVCVCSPHVLSSFPAGKPITKAMTYLHKMLQSKTVFKVEMSPTDDNNIKKMRTTFLHIMQEAEWQKETLTGQHNLDEQNRCPRTCCGVRVCSTTCHPILLLYIMKEMVRKWTKFNSLSAQLSWHVTMWWSLQATEDIVTAIHLTVTSVAANYSSCSLVALHQPHRHRMANVAQATRTGYA